MGHSNGSPLQISRVQKERYAELTAPPPRSYATYRLSDLIDAGSIYLATPTTPVQPLIYVAFLDFVPDRL